MKKVDQIIHSLVPEKYAIFVTGDPGVVTMQEDLKKFKLQMWRGERIGQKEYENANGVFLRFSVNGAIHSGIIQTKNKIETRGMLLEIPPKLQEEGVNLLTILGLPLDRIPLFPFFTGLDKILSRETIRELSQQYWANFTDDVEALKNWYSDFIRFRREIINTQIPQLEPAVPSWLGNLKVYVLYSEKNRMIATAYYRNLEDKDVVSVEKTSEPVGLRTEEAFSNVFTLPSKQDYISGSVQFSKVGEKAFSDWDHPYFSAVEDSKKQVEKFNRAQPSILYDAYTVSRSLVYNWTYKEISKIRELATRLPSLKKTFQHWLKPVQVLLFYFVERPIRGRRTDGTITAYYVNGPEDSIIVKRVENRDYVKWKEELVQQYFPASEGKSFFGFQSSMLTYLSNKIGADY